MYFILEKYVVGFFVFIDVFGGGVFDYGMVYVLLDFFVVVLWFLLGEVFDDGLIEEVVEKIVIFEFKLLEDMMVVLECMGEVYVVQLEKYWYFVFFGVEFGK